MPETVPSSPPLSPPPPPSPERIFQTINAYQASAALKAGIELGVFTAIAEGNTGVPGIARRCKSSERGVAILCDFLTIAGFLNKADMRYALAPDAAAFLNEHSPAYMGSVVDFLLLPALTSPFADLGSVVRTGTTILPDQGTVTEAHPAWETFARAMMPMMAMPAQELARSVGCPPDKPVRILDIAAGHGLFGIAFAQQFPNVQVTALDWPAVLAVAKENADQRGVGDRVTLLPGDAFTVDFGAGDDGSSDYDIVLLTNFLHHFDPPTNETLLRKVQGALTDGGRAVAVEFVPNPDRVTPPGSAAFSLMMLATTPAGNAYTFAELQAMFQNAGFARSEVRDLPLSIEQVVTAYK
jgi:ubiquinone/menaquinone biosynthesis C-methylase UbiE